MAARSQAARQLTVSQRVPRQRVCWEAAHQPRPRTVQPSPRAVAMAENPEAATSNPPCSRPRQDVSSMTVSSKNAAAPAP